MVYRENEWFLFLVYELEREAILYIDVFKGSVKLIDVIVDDRDISRMLNGTNVMNTSINSSRVCIKIFDVNFSDIRGKMNAIKDSLPFREAS